jgi:hypothetical protein
MSSFWSHRIDTGAFQVAYELQLVNRQPPITLSLAADLIHNLCLRQ